MMKEETLQTGLLQEDKRISGVMVNNKYRKNIAADELALCELSWFKGEIVLVDNLKTFYEVFPRLLGSDLLGFDTETRPTFKKGRKNTVSLIQLSTGDFACLFRINKIGIPEELIKLLSDPNVIKAGVAVHDDIRFLKGVKKFSPGGFVDLQSFVKYYGIQSSGLKKLAGIVLGFRISKRQQVTDWEAGQLTEAQQIYAATDAWVCYQIYKKLTKWNE
ncbi:MAG: 3'-5' exonuclease [Bacteroidota bacterium]